MWETPAFLSWSEGQQVSVSLAGPQSVPVFPVPALGLLLAFLSAAGITARRGVARPLGEPRSTSWPSWRQQVHDLDMKSRVHPKYKTKYHVGNWPAYDRALVQRGDITVWLAPDAIATWEGIVKLRLTAVFDAQHGGLATS